MTGCGGTGGSFSPGPPHPLGLNGTEPGANGSSQKAALLLPLSGADGNLGQAMRQAAELALNLPGAPSLIVEDSAGGDAGVAAQKAMDAGAGIILGPLTAAETRAVADPARKAYVPVLAFTSDPSVAQAGVWPLGLSPLQQVRRLVAEARAEGRTRFVALLPDDALGHAMGQALQTSVAEAGLGAPAVQFHGTGMASMTALVREVSDYADRRGPLDKQIHEARDKGDRKTAAALARQPIPPPPFDALLLADTGEQLAEITSLLSYYDVDSPQVRLLGPALWASSRARAGATLRGAWYAAPDPAARSAFVAAYQAKYGASPPLLADLAYDAASLARVVAGEGGFRGGALTRPDGFLGADGLLALTSDGSVRRGLAVFRTNGEMVSPAPQRVGAAGS